MNRPLKIIASITLGAVVGAALAALIWITPQREPIESPHYEQNDVIEIPGPRGWRIVVLEPSAEMPYSDRDGHGYRVWFEKRYGSQPVGTATWCLRDRDLDEFVLMYDATVNGAVSKPILKW